MSEKLFNELTEIGCDVEGALYRMMGDKALYEKLLLGYVPSIEVREIKELADKGDAKGAFNCAHNIKGVSGNLGLTPLYQPICKITDVFRAGTVENSQELYEECLAAFEKIVEIIERNK